MIGSLLWILHLITFVFTQTWTYMKVGMIDWWSLVKLLMDSLSLSSPRKTSILATQTAVHSELGFYALNPFAIMNHQDERKVIEI